MSDEKTFGVMSGYTDEYLSILCQPDGFFSFTVIPAADRSYFAKATEVTYRLDDAPPVVQQWRVINEDRVSPPNGKAFAKMLLDVNRLLIRTTTEWPGERTHTFSIDLDEFPTAWAHLQPLCGF